MHSDVVHGNVFRVILLRHRHSSFIVIVPHICAKESRNCLKIVIKAIGTFLTAVRYLCFVLIYILMRKVLPFGYRSLWYHYTPQGVVDLLNRIGFTYKKTIEVPHEVGASRQEEFVCELAETFSQMDPQSWSIMPTAYHPTHNSRSTYAWTEKREKAGTADH